MLYDQDSLGYIPQIYDSAQEGFPFIFVNGERFDFSVEVLVLGERLVEAHYQLVHQLRIATLRRVGQVQAVCSSLKQFDLAWIEYQRKYISQLIQIEKHSKTIIKGYIQAEEALSAFEVEQKQRGKIFLHGQDYNQLRKQLCRVISRLNSVANIQGKGRDDLQLEVLLAAEQVLNRVTENQALSVRLLAERIRSSWEGVREVLRFFGQNFQMVDPQLRNNSELVAILKEYESSWQRGKRYFLQQSKQSQIIACSVIIDAAKQKYPNFKQLIEQSHPSIFWIVPSLFVLRSLEGEDEGLAQGLLEGDQGKQRQIYENLSQSYRLKRGQGFQLYNKLQDLLIKGEEPEREWLQLRNQLRELGMSLTRVNPGEWNDMLGVLLTEPE